MQQFCTSLNPVFNTNLTDTFNCIGSSLLFTDESEYLSAIKDFYWDFGDGTSSILQNPLPHNYSVPGAYAIKHVITGIDGCVRDTIEKTINIGAKPTADFDLYDTCTNKLLGVKDRAISSFGAISKWTWWLDGSVTSTDSVPVIHNLVQGPHRFTLTTSSIYGCLSDTITKDFSVHPTPIVAIDAKNGCWKEPIFFSARQIDNLTRITQWQWQFDDEQLSVEKDPAHAYLQGGHKNVHLRSLPTMAADPMTLPNKFTLSQFTRLQEKTPLCNQTFHFHLLEVWMEISLGRLSLLGHPRQD